MDIYSSCFVLVLFLTVLHASSIQQLYEGDDCGTEQGKCTNLRDCNIEKQTLKNKTYHRPPLCGYNGIEPIVCCGSDFNNRFGAPVGRSIAYDMCFRYEQEVCPKHNEQENLSDLNYMALIGSGLETNPKWGCAGSLVSRRYVLSAAHCQIINKRNATWVKLGVNRPEPNQLYEIKVTFVHPGYKPPVKYNDIALFRVDRKVDFDEYVRPICLMHQGYFTEAVENFHPISGTSWKTKNNKIIQEASTGSIRIVPTGRCSFVGSTEELPQGTKNISMVCASGTFHEPDECIANIGGGPLFVSNTKVVPLRQCALGVQIGVLSIGEQCGEEEYPGVYTNVSHFMPWIESVIWPENTAYVEVIWN